MFNFKLQDNCKMIDYKSSNITSTTPKEVYNNPLLEFSSSVNLKTGELISYSNRRRNKGDRSTREEKVAVYRDLTISLVNDTYINLQGSYHESFCNGENYSDFNLTGLFTVIQDLHIKFNFNPLFDVIHNLEFGVNIRLPFETKSFLRSIISFKGKEYELREYKGQGFMLKFSFNQYELKIYDKGFQYQLPDNILRFEIKVTTMEFLRAKGVNIRNSRDLLLKDVYSRLGDILNDFFRQLVIYDDSIKLEELKSRERTVLIEGQNPKYWNNLKETNSENYKKKLKRFRELVNKFGTNNLQTVVGELISNKWRELINISYNEMNEIENYLQSLGGQTFPEMIDIHKTNFPRNDTSNSGLLTGNFVSSNTLNSFTGENIEVEEIRCFSCGRNISNQKKGSKFCSEKVYGKEAKRCRNVDSNPRNNFKQREKRIKNGGLLFEIDSYLISNFVH